MIAVIVIAAVLVLILIWGICVFNTLIRLRSNVDESFSTMDIYMKKRYDVIPNLVETVKGYTKHENETLEGVMKARYSCMNASNSKERIAGENALTHTLGRLFKVTENYPELQANKSFMDLQSTLKSLEEEVANSRKYYNGCVKKYNNKVMTFPPCIIASIFKFKKRSLFELDNVEERKTPKVQF
ncbi:MAG: LemA family protein [Clostridia bacterium]|nr:LemA family protein [Clostridia bacterium]